MSKSAHFKIGPKLAELMMGLIMAIISQQAVAQNKLNIFSAESLTKAIKLKADSLELHRRYIESNYNKKDEEIIKQYNVWMEKYDRSVNVPLALGLWLERKKDSRAEGFLLRSTALDSTQAIAWQGLYSIAALRGDSSASLAYVSKAKDCAPRNPLYLYLYAQAFKKTDPFKCDSLLLTLVKRFPTSKEAAASLYSMAWDSELPSEKEALYQLLYDQKKGHPDYMSLRERAMGRYFFLLLNSSPEKAYSLALNMYLEVTKNQHIWSRRMQSSKRIMYASKLMKENKSEEALKLLNQIEVGKAESIDHFPFEPQLTLLKAEAMDASGQTSQAYSSLTNFYSKSPLDSVRTQIFFYGNKLGKDSSGVLSDLSKRDELTEAPNLSFTSYYAGKEIQLADLKGKVVLLTFWFPSCGPCRREFPHLENVVKKFSKDQLVYLGVNSLQKEDGFVLPFMESTGYSFEPLYKSNNENYGSLAQNGYPSNFLIDKEGRIVSSKFLITKDNEDMLEQMIENLLK